MVHCSYFTSNIDYQKVEAAVRMPEQIQIGFISALYTDAGERTQERNMDFLVS